LNDSNEDQVRQEMAPGQKEKSSMQQKLQEYGGADLKLGQSGQKGEVPGLFMDGEDRLDLVPNSKQLTAIESPEDNIRLLADQGV